MEILKEKQGEEMVGISSFYFLAQQHSYANSG